MQQRKMKKAKNTYIVSRDFAWGYEKKMTGDETLQGVRFNFGERNGLSKRTSVKKEADTAFPMITQLREGSSLGSKDGDRVYTIDYLYLSDKANMGTGKFKPLVSAGRWYSI